MISKNKTVLKKWGTIEKTEDKYLNKVVYKNKTEGQLVQECQYKLEGVSNVQSWNKVSTQIIIILDFNL